MAMDGDAPKPRRRWTAGERRTLRAYHLITAFESDQTVHVEGVKLNFACDLDRSKWKPACTLGLYGHRAALYGPEIIFPWTPADWRKSFERDGHALQAKKGSLVFVGQVTSAPITTPFEGLDHPDQRERKLAYICVLSPEGKVEIAHRPLLLLPQGAVSAHIQLGDYSAAFRGMTSKLEQILGFENIESLADEPPENWPKPNEGAAPAYRQAFLALVEAVKEFDEKAYATFGYLMARAEAEDQLLEPARLGAHWKDTTHKATAARRDKSRQRSEPLREQARALIAADGNISLSRCAKLVADAAGKDPRSVSRQISDLFEKRPNGREYRPKRPGT
jgi:hypothetical protein